MLSHVISFRLRPDTHAASVGTRRRPASVLMQVSPPITTLQPPIVDEPARLKFSG
jgi:hypothetical protein